jgi:hypothetical protein
LTKGVKAKMHKKSRHELRVVCTALELFFPSRKTPGGPRPPQFHGCTITLRHTTLGMAPLDEWSALRRDLCMKTHNIHKRQISMPQSGFETAIPTKKRPQNHALDLTATGIGTVLDLGGFFIHDSAVQKGWYWRLKASCFIMQLCAYTSVSSDDLCSWGGR